MIPEAQRLAIAVAVGLISRAAVEEYEKHKPHKMPVFQYYDIPDYLNDLNAMHEAEDELDADQCAEFVKLLQQRHPTYCILPSERDNENEVRYQTFCIVHTTAAQRSEAFLRTLNLWTE